MAQAFTVYRPADIRAELSPVSHSLLRHLSLLDDVDSTSLVLQRLPADEQHGHVVVADRQSAGRGRHGRSWHSPAGQNIYLSLGWHFQCAAGALAQLPLAAAVTVTRALRRAGVRSAVIKWPNDIQVDGAKLAGILVELRGPGTDQALAVIGIGVNVCMPAGGAGQPAIGQSWTDVCTQLDRPAGPDLRNRLCGILLDELLQNVVRYNVEGFYPFADDWNKWDALRGKEVRVVSTDETVEGRATGISDRGGLLVACAASGERQLREFFAGDVSVREA